MRSPSISQSQTRARAGAGTPSVQELLEFERLLADLSAGFINLPAARIDAAITDALRRIVELLGVDRATLIVTSAPCLASRNQPHSLLPFPCPAAFAVVVPKRRVR